MRALTDAEARVIAVLLAARPDRERDRLHQVGVPRSTYHAVRRRAYDEGWLRDRYIPHPGPIGLPFVTTALFRPYADRFDEFSSSVSGEPGNVVLWQGSQLAVAVFFHPDPATPDEVVERVVSRKLAPPPTRVTVLTDGPTVPVYFDFEGLWSHLAGLEGTLAYPHGLGGSLGTQEAPGATSSSHQRWAIGELLRRPFVAGEQGRGGHLVGPFGLPYSQRKLLAKGWVTHRTFLDPARVPSFRGRAADQVVIVSGSPRAGAEPERLFAELTRESRVFPFLFTVGSDRWLLAALGGSSPSTAASAGPRRPVLPTIREYLEGIEIVQEPAAGFSSPVDHRYDRLLPAETADRPTKV